MLGNPDAGSPFQLAPIAHELWVEGRRDGVDFRGRAHALRVTAPNQTAYLVDAGAAPFWVALADITALAPVEQDDDPPLPEVLGHVDTTAAAPAAALRALREFCSERDWTLLDVVADVGEALDRIAEEEADGLVVPSLEHLAPEPADLAPFLDWFLATDAILAVADVGLDTSAEGGRAAATALAHLTASHGTGAVSTPKPSAAGDRHPANVIDLAAHRRRVAGWP